jgi:hypothetical protein
VSFSFKFSAVSAFVFLAVVSNFHLFQCVSLLLGGGSQPVLVWMVLSVYILLQTQGIINLLFIAGLERS